MTPNVRVKQHRPSWKVIFYWKVQPQPSEDRRPNARPRLHVVLSRHRSLLGCSWLCERDLLSRIYPCKELHTTRAEIERSIQTLQVHSKSAILVIPYRRKSKRKALAASACTELRSRVLVPKVSSDPRCTHVRHILQSYVAGRTQHHLGNWNRTRCCPASSCWIQFFDLAANLNAGLYRSECAFLVDLRRGQSKQASSGPESATRRSCRTLGLRSLLLLVVGQGSAEEHHAGRGTNA